VAGNSDKIRMEALRRDIRHLLHFTQVYNLPGIVRRGLLSRDGIEASDVAAYGSGRGRADGRDGAVSLSVTSVYPKMFESKRRASGHPHWVVLLLDPSILWTHRCRFCWRSAASREILDRRSYLEGPWAFGRMFADDEPPQSYNGSSYRGETGIPDCLPTYPDAEVQVLNAIDPGLIVEAWVDRRDHAEEIDGLLAGLPGGERDVCIAPFGTVSNGHREWMVPLHRWREPEESRLRPLR